MQPKILIARYFLWRLLEPDIVGSGVAQRHRKNFVPRAVGRSSHRRYWSQPGKYRNIIDYARRENRIIITLDADFHAVLAVENASAPSVIRIRKEGLKAAQLADLIKNIWPKIQSQLEIGALVTITEKSVRVRNIPLVAPE